MQRLFAASFVTLRPARTPPNKRLQLTAAVWACGASPFNLQVRVADSRAMSASPQAPTPLASHWQAGGWFGSQLGGTAWLFVSALVIAAKSPSSAVVLLACGLAANVVGTLLWAQRAHLDPYRALQILVAAVVLAGAAATRWLELRGEFGLLDPRVGPHTMYVLLASLWLGLTALFELKGRAARKAAAA